MPLLLLAIIGLLWLMIARHRSRLGLDALSVPGALVVAFLVFEVLVVAVTEVTSLGRGFRARDVGLAWGGLLLLGGALAWPEVVRLARRALDGVPARALLRRWRAGIGLEHALLTAIILVVFGVLAVVGWLYRPNQGDSMIYHLPRVVHWIQNRTVAHFATHYLAQIELSPLHEYNLAHLHLLSGGDRLHGYVQLFAVIVCVVGVSELARLLGGSRRAQIIASVLCVTIPSGILEATSTQNNDFAAAIGVGVLMILLAWTPGTRSALRAVLLGFGLGLAALAKGTLPAMIGPAGLLLGLLALRREVRAVGPLRTVRRGLAVCALTGVSAVAVAGPFLWRNVDLFGDPIGPVAKSTINHDQTVWAGAGNVVRSIAGNFRIGDGLGGLETAVSRVALGASGWLYARLGVAPDDWRYAMGTNTDAFKIQDYSIFARKEDFGANPWHVILLTSAGVAVAGWALRRSVELRRAAVLALGLACGFALFTANARWSVFVVRYQVPLLVAWCPVIALALDRLPRWVGRIVVVGLVVACLPALLDNWQRSLLRGAQHGSSGLGEYFDRRPSALKKTPAYENVTRAIADSSCNRVALTNWVLEEYPLWAGLRQAGWSGRIEHVGVQNPSRRFERRRFEPCARVREVTGNDSLPDEGYVVLRFWRLELTLDPERAAVIRVTSPGFSSRIQGLRILPGGGWAFARTDARPTLVGAGSLYVYSDRARRVMLQLASRTPVRPRLVVETAQAPPVHGVHSDEATSFDLQLPQGMTRLRISLAPGASTTAGPLEFASVEVLDADR